jgi:hypothetical protein
MVMGLCPGVKDRPLRTTALIEHPVGFEKTEEGGRKYSFDLEEL